MKITIESEDESIGEIAIHFPVEYLGLSPADLFELVLKPAIQRAVQDPKVNRRLAALGKRT